MKVYKTLRDVQPEKLRKRVVQNYLHLLGDTDKDLIEDLGGYFIVMDSQEEVDLLCEYNTWDTYRYHEDIGYHELWSATNNGGGNTYYVDDQCTVSLRQQFDKYGDFI